MMNKLSLLVIVLCVALMVWVGFRTQPVSNARWSYSVVTIPGDTLSSSLGNWGHYGFEVVWVNEFQDSEGAWQYTVIFKRPADWQAE
jgi:hypothetical protein